MHGFVASDEVEQALRRALCMVLPSRREGYGMVVVEAAAAGTPSVVVAGPDNAAVELIEEGENGFVARSAAPADLAEAILKVREAGPALRERTAGWFERNARALSLESSLETVLAAYRPSSSEKTALHLREVALPRELRLHALPAERAAASPLRRVGGQARDRLGQRGHVAQRHHHPGRAHRLGVAHAVGDDHRKLVRHRLQHRQRLALALRGQDEHVRRAVEELGRRSESRAAAPPPRRGRPPRPASGPSPTTSSTTGAPRDAASSAAATASSGRLRSSSWPM